MFLPCLRPYLHGAEGSSQVDESSPASFFFFSAVLATWRTYSGGVAPSAFDDSPKSGVMGRDVTSSAFFCIGIYACDLLIVWLGVELPRAGGHLV